MNQGKNSTDTDPLLIQVHFLLIPFSIRYYLSNHKLRTNLDWSTKYNKPKGKVVQKLRFVQQKCARAR